MIIGLGQRRGRLSNEVDCDAAGGTWVRPDGPFADRDGFCIPEPLPPRDDGEECFISLFPVADATCTPTGQGTYRCCRPRQIEARPPVQFGPPVTFQPLTVAPQAPVQWGQPVTWSALRSLGQLGQFTAPPPAGVMPVPVPRGFTPPGIRTEPMPFPTGEPPREESVPPPREESVPPQGAPFPLGPVPPRCPVPPPCQPGCQVRPRGMAGLGVEKLQEPPGASPETGGAGGGHPCDEFYAVMRAGLTSYLQRVGEAQAARMVNSWCNVPRTRIEAYIRAGYVPLFSGPFGESAFEALVRRTDPKIAADCFSMNCMRAWTDALRSIVRPPASFPVSQPMISAMAGPYAGFFGLGQCPVSCPPGMVPVPRGDGTAMCVPASGQGGY